MKLVAYEREKLENHRSFYKKTANMRIIEKFAESSLNCVKVEGWTQSTAWICANSLNGTIKRMKTTGIRAISKGGEVFLIKTTE